nr:LuxR family transcriptional regulator [Streptomyces sp. SID5468]
MIGRDDDVKDVAETLRSTGAGARTLLLTGGAGTGKTAVLEHARAAAVQDGVKVLRLDWEEAEGPAGATALSDAVCRVLAKIHDGRLPARITAVRRVQLRTADRDGDLPVLSVLGDMLADAAQYVPFALAVDDVERIPERTADALGLLLRVFRPAGVPVVTVGRPPRAEHAGHAQLLAAVDRVHHLAPLAPADVAALIEQRLQGPVEPDLVTAVLRSLGPLAGNPEAVLSVLTALGERGTLLELDGQLCLTEPEDRLRFTTAVPRAAWPDPAVDDDTLELAAVLARLLHHAELRLTDLDFLPPRHDGPEVLAVARRFDRLVADGVLTTDADGLIAFAVPALAGALRTRPTRQDVRAVHARVAQARADRLGAAATGALEPRIADHVAAAGPLLDDALAVPLLLAAARADARIRWPRGARAYRSALRRLPPHDARTPGALRDAAGLGLRHADYGGVLELGEPLLAGLAAHPVHQPELVFAARTWALASLHEHRSPCGGYTDPRYRAALTAVPAAARLAALGDQYGIWPTPSGQPAADATEETTRTTATRTGPLPAPAELRLLAAAAGPATALEDARRALPAEALSDDALERLRLAAAYGDLAGALQTVLGDRYPGAGHSTAGRYHAMIRNYLAGHWDHALPAAVRIEARGRSGGPPGVAHLARALAAEIHCFRGDFTRAQAWLDLVPDTVAHPLAARARLVVRHWSGDADAARDQAWRDVARAREAGLLAGLERLLMRIAAFGLMRDDPDEARRALGELETLYEQTASPLCHEVLLIVRGLVHRDADSLLAAHRLVQRRGDLHLAWLCCNHLTDIGDDPRTWLAEATRIAHRLHIGRHARTQLGRTAQRRNVPLPRRRPTRQGLTAQDVRLIGLVAEGATNRQIAARLACSEKTVEQRLTRLFQRTGCRSRVELAAAWLDGSLARRLPAGAARPGTDGAPATPPADPAAATPGW